MSCAETISVINNASLLLLSQSVCLLSYLFFLNYQRYWPEAEITAWHCTIAEAEREEKAFYSREIRNLTSVKCKDYLHRRKRVDHIIKVKVSKPYDARVEC